MVSDRETTAQEKCVSLLDDLILSNIVPFDRYVPRANQKNFTCLKIRYAENLAILEKAKILLIEEALK